MEPNTRVFHKLLMSFGTVLKPRGLVPGQYVVMRDEPLHYEMHWDVEDMVELADRNAQIMHCWDDGSDPEHLVRYWSWDDGLKLRYCSIGAAALMGAYIDGVDKGRPYWIDPVPHDEAVKYFEQRHSLNCGAGI